MATSSGWRVRLELGLPTRSGGSTSQRTFMLSSLNVENNLKKTITDGEVPP
ncbi:hypothetical protein RchiOBHm_Chr2g0108701 [Rosa chinensis]|uniref:Uncharacterized protein n=1 Tax=Rosa chinensis TaxID=74649 RepID=A0A2P6RPB3_ROSCH|nr:hypothetical protein RchiOBHm_Chr2g0108701 [Rosa chinensis]